MFKIENIGIFLLKLTINMRVVSYIGPYMSAHVLMNLLNEYEKSNKMRGLKSILSCLFRNVIS